MKVWFYVEGESDVLALEALFVPWRGRMRSSGWGMKPVALGDKSRYLRKIGARVAEKLVASDDDLVVGLPDLYPNAPYHTTTYQHKDAAGLAAVQLRETRRALASYFGARADAAKLLRRFFPSALKHDLEMLLLAAADQLRAFLRTSDRLDNWRHPVEDQDQSRPPKRVVEALFRTNLSRAYRDTIHACGILRSVSDMRPLLFRDSSGQECPLFKSMLDWVGSQTGVVAYS